MRMLTGHHTGTLRAGTHPSFINFSNPFLYDSGKPTFSLLVYDSSRARVLKSKYVNSINYDITITSKNIFLCNHTRVKRYHASCLATLEY